MAVLAGQNRRGRALWHADAGSLVETAVLGITADILAADESRGNRLGTGNIDMLTATDQLAAINGRHAPGCRADGTEIIGRERAMLQRHLARAPAIA